MTIDVFTIGEAMLRLSVPAGQDFERAFALSMHVGGAEANTAAALAGLGRRVAWYSRLPENVLGRRVERELRAFGVDTSAVDWDPGERLGLYFVEHDVAPMAPRVTYDRQLSAASKMGPEDIPWDLAREARLFYVTGITPALSPACEATTIALATFAREHDRPFVFDVNYRSKLWETVQASALTREIAVDAEALLITVEDARDLFGVIGEPVDIATVLLGELRPRNVVVTNGAAGSVWDGVAGPGKARALLATAIDEFGAGDAFAAGVVDGVLEGDLRAGITWGTVLGALAVTRSGDFLHVKREDLEGLRGERDIDR